MINCPICRIKTAKPIYKINTYQYYICNNCQILFLHPIPNPKQLNSYYKNTFQYSSGIAEKFKIQYRSRLIISKLKQIHPAGVRILDVGSGYGYFIKETLKHNLQSTGIEPSRKLYNISQNNNSNAKIFNTNLKDYLHSHNKSKFDYITLIHVIEHVENPQQFINKAISLLNKNGILYIETPNLKSHLYNSELQSYTFLTPPEHIWIFSLQFFERILKQLTNIRIVQKNTYSYPEHFMGIFKKMLNKPFDRFDKLTASKLRVNKLQMNITQNRTKLPNKLNSKRIPSSFKYLLFDKIIAPIFTPLLNIGGNGSILELYIKKN
ncbi:MAG: class I SAM-dependent methyltransferase [bacterium]|nr:class I SAM-dependent methyltransferase [bacterium]